MIGSIRGGTWGGAAALIAALFFTPASAEAGECTNGFCGTPDQSGGAGTCVEGNCQCVAGVCQDGSILVAMTDRGDTYQFADDSDGDGIEDEFDNCPFRSNEEQLDGDGDGFGNGCDMCPTVVDSVQSDLDGDGLGDGCDNDLDGDGVFNELDNCRALPNAVQTDTDGNGQGDVCDLDDDGDGIADDLDACRLLPGDDNNPLSCDDDVDGDGVSTSVDSCPGLYNPADPSTGKQPDADGDGVGDICDLDLDGDGFVNYFDNCVDVYNPSQIDRDLDGLGDAGNWDGTGETCDFEECYVVGGDSSRCLSAERQFDVALLLPRVDGTSLLTGERVDIMLLTNRLGARHQWTARFDAIPDGSNVSLFNAKGEGTTLAPRNVVASCGAFDSEGRCEELNNLHFQPDEPGRYVIQLTATLPDGDDLGVTQATALVVAEVEGDSQGGGCTATGASPLLLLALLTLRRRRRS